VLARLEYLVRFGVDIGVAVGGARSPPTIQVFRGSLSSLETAGNQDAAYLIAQLDVAFAMLNLAKLTRDYQTAQQNRQNAGHYYEAASDLLSRSTSARRVVRFWMSVFTAGS
jgi:hypothetical protein